MWIVLACIAAGILGGAAGLLYVRHEATVTRCLAWWRAKTSPLERDLIAVSVLILAWIVLVQPGK